MKAIFKNAWPYLEDALSLPVESVDGAVPFYERIMGFRVLSSGDAPHKWVMLGRDDIKIGLAENGGDPTQDGCAFEVDDINAAFAEMKANGLEKEISEFETEKQGGALWKVFYVVAPDGLCFWIGEKQA